MKKLIVVAHGIGDHQPDFYQEWEAIIRKNTPGNYLVAGLFWDDVLDKVAEKFPLISQNFADAVARFGFTELQKILSSDAFNKIKDHFMDVLVYTVMQDMTNYIQTTCALRLNQIVYDRKVAKGNTILIGHSLGAAMLPHIVWLERNATGGIPYGGMILLASPLGMESPIPLAIKDLLDVMPDNNRRDRNKMLRLFAGEWEATGPSLLHFLINGNDIVCSDVKIKIGPVEQDLIPVRQSFNPEEIAVLTTANPGCVKSFAAGSTDVRNVISNHDVKLYLSRPEFSTAFQALL
jgi:predicted alpha/beta hydrolase family esterase